MTILEDTKKIQEICFTQKQTGLLDLTKKFDAIALTSFIRQIPNDIQIEKQLKDSIHIAKSNIYKFHMSEYTKLTSFENDKIETSTEVICWKKFTPIEKIGVYIPKNLFSSVLMNIIPAQIAGCQEIIVCTPPEPSPEILWTLNLLGIKKIYTIGGAQAIFAMAYGIGEIPKVDKIFGPGNEFVDTAKKLISNEVAIDMPAGPSEVLVIADKNANKNAVIYDLLSQLEHGKSSKAWLFSDDKNLIWSINNEIINAIQNASRNYILNFSLNNLIIEQVSNIHEAIRKSNQIAPEHLILNVQNPNQYLDQIKHAGSVFIGSNTPESLGDYLSGTNHVLPTNGFAKAFSGLSVLSFGKFITFQTATQHGLSLIAKNIATMANAEGLEFHAKSVIRD